MNVTVDWVEDGHYFGSITMGMASNLGSFFSDGFLYAPSTSISQLDGCQLVLCPVSYDHKSIQLRQREKDNKNLFRFPVASCHNNI